jgi:short-subunit dehydrogenase
MSETALITGGAGGIGRAFAIALSRPGRHLWLADIDEEGARRTAEAAADRGATCDVVGCDVRDPDAMAGLAERTGAVDLLVNNAGVLVTGTVAELSLEDYRRVVDINLWGVIHGCRSYAPRMAERGRGAILNVASLAAYLPLPLMGPYSATKAAVVALSESLRGELRPSGVSVTVLCPSFTRTALIESSSGEGHASALERARSVMHHAGASPEEVARCGLAAVERGDLYAIPTRHGKLAWRAKRLMPMPVCRALGALQRFAV